MKMRLIVFVLSSAVAASAFGDIIHTLDRRRIEGRVIRENESEITVLTYPGEEITITRDNIKKWKKKSTRFDEYDSRLKKTPPETAADHVRLGTWARSRGLAKISAHHFERALALDPKSEAARKALGYKKIDDKWYTPEEAEKIMARRRAMARLKALELKIAVAEDISEARLQQMADLFASFHDDIWLVTAGNAYIKSVEVADKSGSGNILIQAGDIEKEFIGGGGRVAGGKMLVAGKCSVFTFVHESGHLFFGLPDEYKNRGGGCPECVMIGGSMEGFGPGKWKFCTEENHTGPSGPCWPKILQRNRSFRFPNPDFDPVPPVEPKVSVQNSGS